MLKKKPDYAVKAKELHDEIKNYLNIDAEYVRVLVRYDIENLSEETYKKSTGYSIFRATDRYDLRGR